MKKILNVQLPFFIPVWRRVAVVAFTVAWTGFEIYLGNTLWAVFFAAVAAYLVHQFFVDFDPPAPED